MASKKPKTIKNVTEIPNASVKIEVEEKEESASEDVSKVTSDEESKEKAPEETGEETSWKKIILIVLIVVPIGFLMFGGFLFFTQNFNLDFLNKKPEKSITLPKVSTPTPTKEAVNKESYEIEVRNGSGIAGEGARVKEILENEGFKVGAVGNADNSNYAQTLITVSNAVKDEFIEELTKVLEERGTVGKIEKFAEGQEGDVLIIVGSELKE